MSLDYFEDTASQASARIEESQPALEENVRTRPTSALQHAQPAVLGRHVASEADPLLQFSTRATDSQQNQMMLADICFVPIWHDADRWTFCASTMLSYIGTFAKTASTDFITPYKLQSPLTAALGVCAAHETLTGSGRLVLGRLIETEVDNLTWHVPRAALLSVANPSDPRTFNNYSTPANDLQLFREELARVQAMTLYHIMRSFGSDLKQKRQAAQHEPLLAAWTTSLAEHMHKLCCQMDRNTPQSSISEFSAFPRPENSAWVPASGQGSQLDDCRFDSPPLREDELETAHRTILMSYFVRATFAVVTFGICPLISELESLIVSVPASVRARQHDFGTGKRWPFHTFSRGNLQPHDESILSYRELLGLWEQGYMSTLDLEDEYTQLLLVACKGVGILSQGT